MVAPHAPNTESLVPLLLHDYRCLRLEFSGHGRSDRCPVAAYSIRDQVAAAVGFLDQVSGPAVVIGQSFGGGTAFGAAAARPDLVRAIYSEDAYPALFTREWAATSPFLARFGALGEVVRSLPEGFSIAEFTAATGQIRLGDTTMLELMGPQVLAFMGRMRYRTDPAFYDRAGAIDNYWSADEVAAVTAAIRCPVRIAHGDPAAGSLVPTSAIDALAATGQDLTSRHFPGAGLAATDELLQELRVLVGFDNDLATDINRTTNRLRDALVAVAPGVERVVGARLDHPAPRAVLARWPTPARLTAAGPALRRLCRKHAPRAGDRLCDDITTAATAQTVTVPAETALGRVISELAVELERLYQRRSKLAAEIDKVFKAHPLAPILVSMPGIATKTGATILVEIGDGTGFPTGGHIAAYAGISPVTRQSGTSLKGETRARHGNHRLKNALFLAAFCSLRSPDSKAYYARKRAEGKRHNAAIMCLARRRCDVLHAMLRTATPYNPDHPGKPRETNQTPLTTP